MNQKALEEVISSRPRLQIATLISVRPRTLRELAKLTKMTVQGVLKHLAKLEELGVVSETKVEAGELHVRKVYSAKGVRIGDFSDRDLTIIKVTEWPESRSKSEDSVKDLESLAADVLVQKTRIRDQARRLSRNIDELMTLETRISALVRDLPMSDEDRLLLYAAFTEESLEDAERSLQEHYRLKEPREALQKAITKAKKLGRK